MPYPVFVVPHGNPNLQVQAFVRRYTRARWVRTWCTLIRHNIFACARDTRDGLRKPTSSHLDGETGHDPPMGSEVYHENGVPTLNGKGRVRWNWSARRPVASDIPHRHAYHSVSTDTSHVLDIDECDTVINRVHVGTSSGDEVTKDKPFTSSTREASLSDDPSQLRTLNVEFRKGQSEDSVYNREAHGVSSPCKAWQMTLSSDLPRRRTFNIDSIKGEQGRHRQDVTHDSFHGPSGGGLVTHEVPPQSDVRMALQVDDLPRRHTFDIELLNDKQGDLDLDGNDCISQNGKNPTDYATEKLVSKARGKRWGIDGLVGPIAEDHPRRAAGYKQDLDKMEQGKRAMASITSSHRKETPEIKGRRKDNLFMDDVPRRRQYNFTSTNGIATTCESSLDPVIVHHKNRGVTTGRSEESDKAEEFISARLRFNDTEPMQVDAQRNKRGFHQFGDSSNVHRNQTHHSRGESQKRSASRVRMSMPKFRRNGVPLMSDIPLRRSTQSTRDGKWSDEISNAGHDFKHVTDIPTEESTTRIARDDDHFPKHHINDQVGEPGLRWKLNTAALFPIDLPYPSVGYQKKQPDRLRPNSQDDTDSNAASGRGDINDQPLEYSRRWNRKGEPVVSDLPRRRSCCLTKYQIQLSSMGVASDADRKLGEGQRNSTRGQQLQEGVRHDVSDDRFSLEKTSTMHVDNDTGDNDHGARDLLHVKCEAQKESTVCHTFPPHRSFRFDGATIKRKAQRMPSSSGVYADDTHQDQGRNTEGLLPQATETALSPNAHDLRAFSIGRSLHRGLNATNTVQSTAEDQWTHIRGGHRLLGDFGQKRSTDRADSFQTRVRLKRTPIISDLPRRRFIQSVEEARGSGRIENTSDNFDHGPDQTFEGNTSRKGVVEGGHYSQGSVLGSRWKLNTRALFRMDPSRSNVNHQKRQLDAEERGNPIRHVELAKRGRQKREPLVIDLPRRRSFHTATSEGQNELPKARVDTADDGELGRGRQNMTIEHESLENVTLSVFKFEPSPKEAHSQSVKASSTHGVEGFLRILRQASGGRKGIPVPIDYPRRRYFRLDAMTKKQSLARLSLSGVCADDHNQGKEWSTQDISSQTETVSPPLTVREVSESRIGTRPPLGP